jgi:hypothetical protein
MNWRSQIQGGKNWILPREINANRLFRDSHWMKIWKNHLCPSMGPNGGSGAMDSFPIYSLVRYTVEVDKKMLNIHIYHSESVDWGSSGESFVFEACFRENTTL